MFATESVEPLIVTVAPTAPLIATLESPATLNVVPVTATVAFTAFWCNEIAP